MAGALVTTNILQTVVTMGFKSLRERLALVMRTNREYESEITTAKRGATISIALPATIATRDVVPDVVPPAVTAITPTNTLVTLDRWREAPFAMDDKGLQQVDRGIIPMEVREAAKALANYIEQDVWLNYKKFYGFAGVPGTTPFANDLQEYLDAMQQADAQLMDVDPRFVILDTYAKANALGTPAVQNASWRGSPEAFRRGEIGEVLGARWDMSQLVPRHIAGTAAGATTDAAGYAVGVKTVTLASAGTGTILVGDIITFAGDTQTYVVVTGDADVSNGGTVVFEPGLKVAIPASATAIAVKPSHRVNLLMHPFAIAFAMAPLAEQTRVENVAVAQANVIDEESGLSLRLEVTRQHRQYQWAFDALWGSAVPRPEFGVRIAG